jgi:hypothetical protein
MSIFLSILLAQLCLYFYVTTHGNALIQNKDVNFSLVRMLVRSFVIFQKV